MPVASQHVLLAVALAAASLALAIAAAARFYRRWQRANLALAAAVAAQRQAQERQQLIFNSNPLPTWIYDRETLQFLEVNDAALRQYGYSREEFLKMRITDIRPAEEIPRLMDSETRHANDRTYSGESRHRRKDGTLFDAAIALSRLVYGGRPANLAVASDVTDRKTLEQNLRHAQKMEAMGRLAGGVAHDFNNILGVILGYAQVLELELADQSGPREMLAEIVTATRRAAGLTQQLLTFSRKQKMEFRRLDLNEAVGELANMLRRVLGDDVVLEMRLAPEPAPVDADPGMIAQVLVNLAMNARDAMPKGGALEIRTERRSLSEPEDPARVGEFVRLSVRDTGRGMARDTLGHLFEPFFTTKDVGKGTGLGLATALGIIQEHQGWIEVDSTVGQGSAFHIFLPLRGSSAPTVAPKPRPLRAGTGEGILLVEDDPALRALEIAVLHRQGYRVFEADSGPAALDLWGRHRDEIRLLITDMVMPQGLNGADLARLLRTERPDLNVIVTSGYLAGGWDQSLAVKERFRFMPKPFEAQTLAQLVSEALNRGPAPAVV